MTRASPGLMWADAPTKHHRDPCRGQWELLEAGLHAQCPGDSESFYSSCKSKTCLLPNRCNYKYQVISTVQRKPNDSDLVFGAMSALLGRLSGLSERLIAARGNAESLIFSARHTAFSF